MKQLLAKYTVVTAFAGFLTLGGCGASDQPTGPEMGSVQQYLDENPDIAARVEEGDADEADEAADDGTGE